MKKEKQQIVVLIPAYQPGDALLQSTRALLTAGMTVVVVNDGSEETYTPVFDQLDARVTLLRHEANQGKGVALKSGYRYIQDHFEACIIVTADADGQHTPADIRKMAEAYMMHPGEVLLGSRTFDGKDVPLRSWFGNTLTRKIFALVTGQKIGDTQTGLRAFDSSLVPFMLDVPGERFEYETNVLLEANGAGVILSEIPIHTVYENNNKTSHFDPVKDSWAIYKEIIKFTSSSLIAFAIDFLLLLLFAHLTSSWDSWTSVVFSNVTARIISASVNFAINDRLVFKHKGNFYKGAAQYFALAGCILIGNTLLLTVLTELVGIALPVAKIITELISFSLSYIVQRNIIFAHTSSKGGQNI